MRGGTIDPSTAAPLHDAHSKRGGSRVVRTSDARAGVDLPAPPPVERAEPRAGRAGGALTGRRRGCQVATEPDYKFDLAIQLGELAVAQEIAEKSGTEAKWKQLGELAMSSGELPLAEACLTRACDLSGLLLMFSSTGSAAGMERLAELAKAKGKHNVAFLALFLLQKTEACVQVGESRRPAGRFPAPSVDSPPGRSVGSPPGRSTSPLLPL